MSQSADKLVSNEQRTSNSGYQSIEDAKGVRASENETTEPQARQSFLSKVRKARQESIGCWDFCVAFFALLLGSIVWFIVLIIIITVPIVMIVIGAKYFYNCPAEPMIPISVIVAGCVATLSNIINLVNRFKSISGSNRSRRITAIRWINGLISMFLSAWLGCMCYWVYSADPNFNSTDSEDYCNPRLYGFVFWLLIFFYVFLGIIVVALVLAVSVAFMCL